VLTRKGYKPVIEANPTRKSKVIEVEFTNGRKLKATKDHRIYTKNRGFIPLNEIRYSDIIEEEENYKRDVIKQQKLAQKNVRVSSFGKQEEKIVYNLSVAEQPEYFANGILVHNCHDMIRYYCMSRPRPKMNNKTRKKLREARKRRIRPISSSTGY